MKHLSAHVEAKSAAERLGVSRATLYAYVSRGLIRTLPHPSDPRARLYSSADIERLVLRKTRDRRPADAAVGALDWGLPALNTRICDIAAGRPSYRGADAVTLSRTATFEAAADLLWGMSTLERARFGPAAVQGWQGMAAHLSHANSVARALALLTLLQDEEVPGLAGVRLAERGGLLVKALARALVPNLESDGPLHEALATAWRAGYAADPIRQALVLIADHEMNASTFAVRVVASTGATLTASLIAGLAALSGPRHGGAVARVAALFDEVCRVGDPQKVVRDRLKRGEPLPGFGHRLYPEGDPRAAALLARIHAPFAAGLIETADAETGLKPTVDFALFVLARAHGLPPDAALRLFAIGRSAGWVAHAMEQRESGRLIRPRARFLAEGDL